MLGFVTEAFKEASNLQKRIEQRRSELDQLKCQLLLRSLKERGIKTEKQSSSAIKPSNIVKLNVGGTKIDVKRSTITRFSSKLKWMLRLTCPLLSSS